MRRLIAAMLALAAVAGGTYYFRPLPERTSAFVSSTPQAGSRLAASPINVVVDFDRDLGNGSYILVRGQGKNWVRGGTSIDSSGTTMRQEIAGVLPDGSYQVIYRACWRDGRCEKARYTFSLEGERTGSYADERGKSVVRVNMKNIAFKPLSLRISRGSTVAWYNDDEVDHYVNTDAHPSHTYYPTHNSRVIAPGQSYETSFSQPGIYPYHCSAHAANMTGSIIVE